MPTAYVLYNAAVVKEDRAPLGSDPSALAMPHGIGRHLYPVPSFIKYAGGSNAINPSRKAAVSTNFSGVDLKLFFCYSEVVDLPLVFDVFSFEVCAEPFSGISAGSGEKINLLQVLIPGRLKRRSWARILVMIIAVSDLFLIPIGTVIGVYTLWVLLNDETAKLFAQG